MDKGKNPSYIQASMFLVHGLSSEATSITLCMVCMTE